MQQGADDAVRPLPFPPQQAKSEQFGVDARLQARKKFLERWSPAIDFLLVLLLLAAIALPLAFGQSAVVTIPTVLATAALVVIARNQLTVTTHQLDAAQASASAAQAQADAMREANDRSTYLHLARLWYDLKHTGYLNPQYVRPEFTTLYSAAELDVYSDYEFYAWMCWGHAEDCYLQKHQGTRYATDEDFLPTLRNCKELHFAWLLDSRDHGIFGEEFLEWVTGDLLPDRCEPRTTPTSGSGAFAVRAIKQRDYIGFFEGTDSENSSQYSVQFGSNRHIEPSDRTPLRCLNHSCDPNAFFRGRNLYARREIARNEEITFDYNCHQAEIRVPFQCNCGTDGCVETVRGWSHLTQPQKQERHATATEWLLQGGDRRASDDS